MASNNPTPFDQIGKRYDESFAERDAQVAEGEWLLAQLDRPARVLDLGCGTGVRPPASCSTAASRWWASTSHA